MISLASFPPDFAVSNGHPLYSRCDTRPRRLSCVANHASQGLARSRFRASSDPWGTERVLLTNEFVHGELESLHSLPTLTISDQLDIAIPPMCTRSLRSDDIVRSACTIQHVLRNSSSWPCVSSIPHNLDLTISKQKPEDALHAPSLKAIGQVEDEMFEENLTLVNNNSMTTRITTRRTGRSIYWKGRQERLAVMEAVDEIREVERLEKMEAEEERSAAEYEKLERQKLVMLKAEKERMHERTVTGVSLPFPSLSAGFGHGGRVYANDDCPAGDLPEGVSETEGPEKKQATFFSKLIRFKDDKIKFTGSFPSSFKAGLDTLKEYKRHPTPREIEKSRVATDTCTQMSSDDARPPFIDPFSLVVTFIPFHEAVSQFVDESWYQISKVVETEYGQEAEFSFCAHATSAEIKDGGWLIGAVHDYLEREKRLAEDLKQFKDDWKEVMGRLNKLDLLKIKPNACCNVTGGHTLLEQASNSIRENHRTEQQWEAIRKLWGGDLDLRQYKWEATEDKLASERVLIPVPEEWKKTENGCWKNFPSTQEDGACGWKYTKRGGFERYPDKTKLECNLTGLRLLEFAQRIGRRNSENRSEKGEPRQGDTEPKRYETYEAIEKRLGERRGVMSEGREHEL